MTQIPTKKFINDTQVKQLQDLKWSSVNPQGAFLNLFPEDFKRQSVWRDICDQLNIPHDSESATVLYFATSTNEQ